MILSCGKKEKKLISEFPQVDTMKFPSNFLWELPQAAEQMEETPNSDWGKFIQDAYKINALILPVPEWLRQVIFIIGNYTPA